MIWSEATEDEIDARWTNGHFRITIEVDDGVIYVIAHLDDEGRLVLPKHAVEDLLQKRQEAKAVEP